ncbi:MAG: hypothetical protein AABW88_01460 [Nanoarchaeota archaeon]
MVALLFVLISCTQTEQSSSPIFNNQGKAMVNIVQVNCSTIADSGARDVCLTDVLTIKKDVSICDQFADFDLKIKCYAEVAGATKNPNICVKLTVDAWRDSCYYSAAVSKKDPVICAGIIYAETRSDCYRRMDLSKFNEREVCTQLWTPEQKSECSEMFRLNG